MDFVDEYIRQLKREKQAPVHDALFKVDCCKVELRNLHLHIADIKEIKFVNSELQTKYDEHFRYNIELTEKAIFDIEAKLAAATAEYERLRAEYNAQYAEDLGTL